MASVTAMVGGAIVNGLAFTGIGYRFSKTHPLVVTGEVPLEVGSLVYISANDEDPQEKGRRWATDPWWMDKSYPIICCVSKPGQPSLCDILLKARVHKVSIKTYAFVLMVGIAREAS